MQGCRPGGMTMRRFGPVLWCAWVLWVQDPTYSYNPAKIVTAFDTWEACEVARQENHRQQSSAVLQYAKPLVFACLPDTVRP